MFKKLMLNSFIFGITPQISRILGIVTYPIITKYLTDEDFGKYGIIMALVVALNIIQSLGFNILFTNSFIKHPNHYKLRWRYLYGILIVWMVGFAILQGICYYLYFPDDIYENIYLLIGLLILPSIMFGPVSVIGNTYYVLKQEAKPIGIRAIIFGNLTIGLNLLFIAHYKMGFMGWVWTNFIITVLLNASYWPLINIRLNLKPIFIWKKNLISSYLKITLPTLPHYFSNYLLGSSAIMVMNGVKIPESTIGKYSSSTNLSGYGDIFVHSLNTAFNPFIMSLYTKGKDRLAKDYIYLMQYLVFLATFTAAMWSKEIVDLLLTHKSLKGIYPIFIILVMALNYRPMYIASSNMFHFHENTNRLWKITFLGGIIFTVLSLIFVPYFGMPCIPILYFIALQYIGQISFYMKEYTQYTKVQYSNLIILFSTIILTFIAYYTVDLSLTIRILFYTPIAILLSVLTLKKVKWVKNN